MKNKILIIGMLLSLNVCYAQNTGVTLAHRVLEQESKITGVAADYTVLDQVISEAQKNLALTLTKNVIADAATARAALKIIDKTLKDLKFRTTAKWVLLSTTLTPNVSDGLYHKDCYTGSLLYYAILKDTFGQPVTLVARQKREISNGIKAHMHIRWRFADGSYLNWDNTALQNGELTEADFKTVGYFPTSSLELTNENLITAYLSYSEANILETRGESSKVLEALNEAIKLNPKFALAYLSRGRYYQAQGNNNTQALADFADAINADPENTAAYYNRGVIYSDQGNYTKALADFNKAIELDPTYASSYLYRGFIYMQQQDYTKALADLNKSIVLDKTSAEAYSYRAMIYYTQKNYAQALIDFTTYIELNPDNVESYNYRGTIYVLQGEYSKALIDFNKSIQLKSNSIEAYLNRGHVFVMLKEYTEAVEDYSKVIELDPNNIMAYLNRGVSYENLNNLTLALGDFSKLVELVPGNATYLKERNALQQLLNKK